MKFRIICNSGNLSAGATQYKIELIYEAENIEMAIKKFNDEVINAVYGRKIISIEQIDK